MFVPCLSWDCPACRSRTGGVVLENGLRARELEHYHLPMPEPRSGASMSHLIHTHSVTELSRHFHAGWSYGMFNRPESVYGPP